VEEETDEPGANAGVRVHRLRHGIPDDPLRSGAPVVVVAVNEPCRRGRGKPPPRLDAGPLATELRVQGRQPQPAVEADVGAPLGLGRRGPGDEGEQGDCERHQLATNHLRPNGFLLLFLQPTDGEVMIVFVVRGVVSSGGVPFIGVAGLIGTQVNATKKRESLRGYLACPRFEASPSSS
jgi:hypothetical protein